MTLSLLTLCDSKLWLIKTKMCDGGGRAVTYSIISLLKIITFFICLIVIVATYKPVSDIRHLIARQRLTHGLINYKDTKP
jgi:hypothetical protein